MNQIEPGLSQFDNRAVSAGSVQATVFILESLTIYQGPIKRGLAPP
jgi:hypothetical protein